MNHSHLESIAISALFRFAHFWKVRWGGLTSAAVQAANLNARSFSMIYAPRSSGRLCFPDLVA
jgi:hypothetical protein